MVESFRFLSAELLEEWSMRPLTRAKSDFLPVEGGLGVLLDELVSRLCELPMLGVGLVDRACLTVEVDATDPLADDGMNGSENSRSRAVGAFWSS